MGSVRFRLGAFLLVFAASAAFAGGDLLKWIPAGTEYVVGVDADSLRSLSCFRELTENGSEAGEVLAEFERNYNLRFSDCADLPSGCLCLWRSGKIQHCLHIRPGIRPP